MYVYVVTRPLKVFQLTFIDSISQIRWPIVVNLDHKQNLLAYGKADPNVELTNLAFLIPEAWSHVIGCAHGVLEMKFARARKWYDLFLPVVIEVSSFSRLSASSSGVI
jgi:hypothetical protein